jgi:glycosyltransferase involved in cell wall biosynthesis
VPEVVRAWPEAEFVVFASREAAEDWRAAPWAGGVRLVELPVSARTRFRRVALEQTLLAAAAVRHRVDLLHSLATTQPAFVPGVRTVTTILDVIYKRLPETHAGMLTLGMSALVPLAAHTADRIVTISQWSGDDIVHFLGVGADKVDVVPLGPGRDAVAPPTDEAELRARLELGDAPVVFSPSAKRPHKNLPRLIEAVSRLDGVQLVIPGYANPHEAELRSLASQLGVSDRVRFPGWLPDADVEGLYALCACMCFPSLAEGFGLPVLEAMRRGVPVACSNATSLPEVAGDAALLFDPESVDAIAAALGRLLGDAALRDDLARRGREQALSFSWARTAEGTVASYRRALGV